MTHICVGNLNTTATDNGLSPGRCQAIIWTSAGIMLIRPLGTNFSEILIESHTFSWKKMHLKMSSAKRRPFCPGINELTWGGWFYYDYIEWLVSAYDAIQFWFPIVIIVIAHTMFILYLKVGLLHLISSNLPILSFFDKKIAYGIIRVLLIAKITVTAISRNVLRFGR